MSKEDKEQTRYKAYLDQRQSLIDIEVEASKSFDHWVVTLAGGALGLSITFIEKIAPHPGHGTLWLLGLSWTLLLITILVSLTSHLTSQSAMRRQRDILDSELEKEPETPLTEEERRNRYAAATHWLNISAMVTFAAGIVFLCIFSLLNPPRKEVSNDRQETSRGQTAADHRGSSSTETSKADTATETTGAKATEEVKGETNTMNKTGQSKPSGMDKTAGVVAPKNAKTTPVPKPPPPPPPPTNTNAPTKK